MIQGCGNCKHCYYDPDSIVARHKCAVCGDMADENCPKWEQQEPLSWRKPPAPEGEIPTVGE